MPHIVIVGDRESGKTTFLALLYAAQVKSGSDRADSFRFHAAVDSLDEISGAFQHSCRGVSPTPSRKKGFGESRSTSAIGNRVSESRRAFAPADGQRVLPPRYTSFSSGTWLKKWSGL